MYIYFDETGNTGRDIMNLDQPVQVLASTNLTASDAAALKSAFFSGVRSAELKHAALSSRGKGQRQIADLIRELRRREAAIASVAHKPYTLLALLVDYWVEPAMRLDGVNLYERGGNIALSNVLWVSLSAYLGPEGLRSLLLDAQKMLFERDLASYEAFWRAVDAAITKRPELGEILSFLSLSDMRLGGFEHLRYLPERLADLGTYGLLESVAHWRTKSDEKIEIRFDRSAALRREQSVWEAVLSPDVPPALVGQDRRTIQFPLNVGSIEFSESQSFDQLQLVDIVAGATATYYRHFYNHEEAYKAEYAARLKDAGIKDLVINVVWPTGAVAPADLGTDGPVISDVADFLAAQIVARRNNDRKEGDETI